MAEYVKSVSDCEIHSIDYRDISSSDKRVDHLIECFLPLKGETNLVGSSLGGYVSTQVKIAGLMLLAPAFYLEGYEESSPSTPC